MNNLPILLRALFDRRTPGTAKVLVVLAALYGVSPIDIIPDFLPLIGQLDDIGLIIVVFLIFLKMTEPVRKDMQKEKGIIDAKIVP